MQTSPAHFGPYQIQELLGQGAMGQVFRAWDSMAQRSVALKVIRLESCSDPSVAAERFLREGRLAASLHHPGIVAVHTAGERDGVHYLVSELVEGARDLQAAFATSELEEQVRLIRDVARALGYAHARGVVHRDLKPENVLVTAEGQVKITDFGLASGVDMDRLTRTGTFVGTPAYMAPEQFSGKRGNISPASDVWALGVLLYEILANRLPFEGNSMAELAGRILQAKPEPPSAVTPGVPAVLEAICATAMARVPASRYADGEVMALALDEALADPERWAPLSRGALFWRRHKNRLLLAGWVFFMLLLAVGLPVAFAPSEAPEPAASGEARSVDGASSDSPKAVSPRVLKALRDHADVALRQGDGAEALALCDQATRLGERGSAWEQRRVGALLLLGDPDQALDYARGRLARLMVRIERKRLEVLELEREWLKGGSSFPGDGLPAAWRARFELVSSAGILREFGAAGTGLARRHQEELADLLTSDHPFQMRGTSIAEIGRALANAKRLDKGSGRLRLEVAGWLMNWSSQIIDPRGALLSPGKNEIRRLGQLATSLDLNPRWRVTAWALGRQARREYRIEEGEIPWGDGGEVDAQVFGRSERYLLSTTFRSSARLWQAEIASACRRGDSARAANFWRRAVSSVRCSESYTQHWKESTGSSQLDLAELYLLARQPNRAKKALDPAPPRPTLRSLLESFRAIILRLECGLLLGDLQNGRARIDAILAESGSGGQGSFDRGLLHALRGAYSFALGRENEAKESLSLAEALPETFFLTSWRNPAQTRLEHEGRGTRFFLAQALRDAGEPGDGEPEADRRLEKRPR